MKSSHANKPPRDNNTVNGLSYILSALTQPITPTSLLILPFLVFQLLLAVLHFLSLVTYSCYATWPRFVVKWPDRPADLLNRAFTEIISFFPPLRHMAPVLAGLPGDCCYGPAAVTVMQSNTRSGAALSLRDCSCFSR